MKRIILLLFLIVSIALTVVSAVYLLVNLVVIPEKIGSVQDVELEKFDPLEEAEILPEKSDSEQYLLSKTLKPVIPFWKYFYTYSRDLSAVTPLILFWFFWSVSRNTLMFLVGRITSKDIYSQADTFPLPPSYKTTWIQLGFLGTLWGFLIIGEGIRESITAESFLILDILMKAFGTALISTFTGVFMAYVSGPLTTKFWKWAANIPDTTSSRNPETVITVLSERLKEVADRATQLSGTLDKLEGRISKLSPEKLMTHVSEINKGTKDLLKQGPKIEGRIKTGLDDVSEKLGKVHETLKDGKQAMAQGIQDAITQVRNESTNLQKHQDEKANSLIAAAQQAGMDISSNVSGSIEKATSSLTAEIRGQIQPFKEGTATELQNIRLALRDISKEVVSGKEALGQQMSIINKTLNAQIMQSSEGNLPVVSARNPMVGRPSLWERFLNLRK